LRIHMEDKSLGYTIMAVTVVVMLVYFVWAFPGVIATLPYSEWAFKLPVIAAVYMILFIILWIGYTMATTPPPIPLDTPLDLDNEFDLDDEEEEEESEE
jgi:hypothetical protein